MDLVYCVAFVGVATVLYVVVLLVSRMPDQPSWATELVMNDIANTVITGLVAFAVGYGTRFALDLREEVVGVKEIALTAAILVACFVVVRLLAPRRRLAQYTAELATRNAAKGTAADGHGPSGKPTLPRAA